MIEKLENLRSPLTRFAILDKKALSIILKEKSGGRLLRLRLENTILIKSREI